MKAYVDTGVFIDYLIGRGHAGPYLRTAPRRGRVPAQLGTDAESCFKRIAARHTAITSCITCYEVEEAMFARLSLAAKGVPHAARFIVPAARAVITQTLMTVDTYGIQLADLTRPIVLQQCTNFDLQKYGVRAADALHVTTAQAHNVDLIISADDDILQLDNMVNNTAGNPIRCVDSDAALALL